MPKYLILEPELDQSISIAKILKKNLPKVKIYGGYIKRLNKLSFFINKSSYFDAYVEVDYSNREFFNKFDIVIPTGADSTERYLKLFNPIQLGDVVFSAKNLITAQKKEMHKIVNKLDVPHPQTFYSYKEVNYYPVFYKNAYENTPRKTNGLIKNESQLRKIDFRKFLIQEYIKGNSTFGVAFIAHEGDLVCSTIHEEKLSFPLTGGSAAIISRIHNERLIDLTQKIIKHIQYSGWGLAEFKYCQKRKDFVFMEINPKFWASIDFSLINNKDFAHRLFNLKLYSKPNKSAVYLHRLLGLFFFQYAKFLPHILKAKKIIISWKKIIFYFFKKFIPV